MKFRAYNPETDKDAIHRIWREVGWLEEGKEEVMDMSVSAGEAWVADVDGSAECLVMSAEGQVRYGELDLSLAAITGVTTSRVVRKQGAAGRLLAQTLRRRAEQGILVAGLGMFEQGFYNRLGFGTGSYEHRVGFDPARLSVPPAKRIPCRLSKENWEEIHAARLNRRRRHGSINLIPGQLTQADLTWSKTGFGLGYRHADGTLSHYVWVFETKGEHGPYEIGWMVYHDRHELFELLGLVRNLGDQVNQVTILQPPDIQMQDLVQQPFKTYRVTEKSNYAALNRASAWWQLRLLDLPGALAQTHLGGETVRFNLELSDPIGVYSDDGEGWSGLAGNYAVTLGPESSAVAGTERDWPTLKTTINAFTRMWAGCLTPTALAMTDDLHGADALIAALDRAITVPEPRPDWEF